jgi:DNA-binding LacI/PurR family transcriptional regulator
MADALGHFIDQSVDAVVVIAPNAPTLQALARASDLPPLVAVTSAPDVAGLAVADADQALGARLAVEYLVGLGRRRIAHIAGPADFYHSLAREAAWKAVVEEHSLETGPVVAGDWTGHSGLVATAQLLAAGPIDAIFAGNDLMAMGALVALKRAGLRVPGDVAVVGFDNLAGSDVTDPPLTTVDQDHEALGGAVLELLDDQLRDASPQPPQSDQQPPVMVPPRLIVRASA